MTEFSSHAPGTPCWVDLMSPDVDASAEFYTAVFGWTATDDVTPDGDRIYVSLTLDGKAVAGLAPQGPGMNGLPPIWNTYIATDDVAAISSKVVEAGGSVVMPAMQVMEVGEMAVYSDTTGAMFSVWKAGTSIGAEVGNVPNTYSWNEHLSRDVGAATGFYQSVFGWQYETMEMAPGMGQYHVITGGENGGMGGLMAMPADMPKEVPSHWSVYFNVSDLDATLGLITGLGGSVVFGPQEMPGVGTLASILDPQGGSFSLMQPAGEE